MKVQRINPAQLFDGTPYGMSQGTVDEASGLVFLSGQVSWDENSQVRGDSYGEQTRRALQSLRIALDASGSDPQHVLHLRIYVRGEVAEHLQEVAPAIVEFFDDARPAVTGIGVASLATPDTLVELEVVARRA